MVDYAGLRLHHRIDLAFVVGYLVKISFLRQPAEASIVASDHVVSERRLGSARLEVEVQQFQDYVEYCAEK